MLPNILITEDALPQDFLPPSSLCQKSPEYTWSLIFSPQCFPTLWQALNHCKKHVMAVTPLLRKLWVLIWVGIYFHTTFVANCVYTSLSLNLLWCYDFIYDAFTEINFYVIRSIQLSGFWDFSLLICLANLSQKMVGWINFCSSLNPTKRQWGRGAGINPQEKGIENRWNSFFHPADFLSLLLSRTVTTRIVFKAGDWQCLVWIIKQQQ